MYVQNSILLGTYQLKRCMFQDVLVEGFPCSYLAIHSIEYRSQDIPYLAFNTAKCDRPVLQSTFITITGFSDPAIQGTNITFTCPPGLVLTGPITSTCMENGEWDADLWSLRCKGKFQLNSKFHTLIIIYSHVQSKCPDNIDFF